MNFFSIFFGVGIIAELLMTWVGFKLFNEHQSDVSRLLIGILGLLMILIGVEVYRWHADAYAATATKAA